MSQLFETKPIVGKIVPRDYQLKDVEQSFKLWDKGVRGTLTRVFTGGGKCLGRGTPVLMHDGSIKPVEEIEFGDELMGPDSKPRVVTSTTKGTGQLYRITPKRGGDSFVVNDEHILCLKATNFSDSIDTICGIASGEHVNISVKEYLKERRSFRHIMKGYRVAVDFEPQHTLVDPYFLGTWLGDGTASKAHITTVDKEIVECVHDTAAEWSMSVRKHTSGGTRTPTYCIEAKKEPGFKTKNQLLDALRTLEVVNNKHIPDNYKHNTQRARLELLAGLLDTDGTVHKSGFSITQKRKRLAEDIAYVARSLGFSVTLRSCTKTCTNTGASGTYYRIQINGECSLIPTRICRKQAPQRRQKKDPLVFGFQVTDEGIGEYFGFTLDGDRKFLLGDFTVTHNTLQTCIKFQKWLERGDDYRCMLISYEKQLVWQSAQEVRDYTGLEPGIEMQDQHVDWDQTPQIIVASRQTLMRHKLAEQGQKDELSRYGLGSFGLLLSRQAKSLITEIKRKMKDGEQPDFDLMQEQIEEWNRDPRCNHELGMVSRLWKFNPDFNWLIAWDEAHKHAYKLKTVHHIIDWFHVNPNSRDTGMTATPQRYDQVSIGDKMFPGIAIDYPLWSLNEKCAVRDGFAVPYVQKFIRVESLDFRRLKQECKSQLEWDSQVDQALEGQLAKCVEPMLSGPLGEMVENRRTIIFSPSVDMAKNVAHYINARRKCECNCGTRGWYAKELIGNGIRCTGCDEFISDEHIVEHAEQARSVYGEIPPIQRREHYAAHQNGQYQFLSVCGLCREGYNDRDISCAVILRPVSKAAASLAEQMKGRASRVAPGVIDGLATAAERIEAIKNSCKPNALIVDLVGVTGLADCANSAMIYAEGMPDEVIEIAERALDEGEEDIAKAVEEAKEEYDSEVAKQERQAKALQEKIDAARRARLQATVNYEIEEIGYASTRPTDASFKQLKYIRFLGMDFVEYLPSKRQAGRIITQLKEEHLPPEQVAYTNGIPEGNWRPVRASAAQRRRLTREGKVYDKQTITPHMASQLIDGSFDVYQMIRNAETHETLDAAGRYVRNMQPGKERDELIAAGKARRSYLEDF